MSNYLSEPAVQQVLGLAGGAAAGSAIVFTYIHRGVLDHPRSFYGAARVVDNVRRLGEPWTYGIDPGDLPALLAPLGLLLEVDLGADDYRARCPREWGHGGKGYAFYRIAVALTDRASRPRAGSSAPP